LESGFVLDYTTINTTQTNYVFKGDGTYYLSADVALYGTNTTWEAGAVLKAASNVTLSVNTPITWGGTPFRPILMTARDDPSAGELITPTNALSGYYATTALRISGGTTNTLALQNLRIAHAQTAISLDGGAGHVIRHAQVVNCQKGIAATNAEFSLRNALFHNVLTNFTGSSSTGRVEHLTSDIASWLNNNIGPSLYLTNCILAGVTNLGSTAVTNAVARVNPDGVFQSVGAGYHYLASGSPYRDYAGASTNINATLAKELKSLTTYPPIVLTNDFTVNTTLSPQAQRDTGTLDLGWHYDPLDYCWSGLNLTNATLTLTNGVAVGIYGIKGTTLRTSTCKFLSEGTPVNLNRLVRYQSAQEQPLVWGTTGSDMYLLELVASSPPEARFQFTDIAFLANTMSRRQIVYGQGTYAVSPFALSHCQVRGAYVQFGNSVGSYNNYVYWTNNLLEGCELRWFRADQYLPTTVNLYNNLFYKGTNSFTTTAAGASWTVKDNLFDCDGLTNGWYGSAGRGFNGYRSGLTSLGGTNDVVNLVISYQAGLATNWYGVLGTFYYPTNGGASSLTNLFNAGSRNATNAGLYHFTTTTNQVKEAGSVVDIGWHYVAADANGNPLDYDGDGIPDYLEDRNGNGSADSGETGWQSYNSPNGLVGNPAIQVFTPLKP
jgi:hypothetical protein